MESSRIMDLCVCLYVLLVQCLFASCVTGNPEKREREHGENLHQKKRSQVLPPLSFDFHPQMYM